MLTLTKPSINTLLLANSSTWQTKITNSKGTRYSGFNSDSQRWNQTEWLRPLVALSPHLFEHMKTVNVKLVTIALSRFVNARMTVKETCRWAGGRAFEQDFSLSGMKEDYRHSMNGERLQTHQGYVDYSVFKMSWRLHSRSRKKTSLLFLHPGQHANYKLRTKLKKKIPSLDFTNSPVVSNLVSPVS